MLSLFLSVYCLNKYILTLQAHVQTIIYCVVCDVYRYHHHRKSVSAGAALLLTQLVRDTALTSHTVFSGALTGEWTTWSRYNP